MKKTKAELAMGRVKAIIGSLRQEIRSREEAIFAGISSGAAVWAALEVARELGRGKRVVPLLPSLGERYLSHELYAGLTVPTEPAP